MAHYAKVLEGRVLTVIVVNDDTFWNSFTDTSPGTWIQTSYNTRGGVHYDANGIPDEGTPLRKNFAAVGYSYDSQCDAFIPPKQFSSWTLNEETCLWQPPTPYPSDGRDYEWNEAEQSWDLP